MIKNDWTGNKTSVFKTLGSSNHTLFEREENDYYATEPKAATLLCELEKFNNHICECACGEGHLSKGLIKNGYNVFSSDLIDRGYGLPNVDFLKSTMTLDGDIITNPPYKFAKEFVEKSLSIINPGNKVAMFLKIQFLESKGRRNLFINYPPKTVYISSNRLLCAKNADFKNSVSSAVAYAWFVWEKGYNKETILKWFN